MKPRDSADGSFAVLTCWKIVGLPVRSLIAVCVLASSAAISLPAKNLIKVQMGGRSFVVDIDSSDVQKNLKPASPQAGLSKLPSWLFPSPGQTPLRDNYDVNTGIASATFAAGGTVDQVIAYYAQLLASKGFPASAPLGQPNSKIVSGKNSSATVSVIVNTPFRNPAGLRTLQHNPHVCYRKLPNSDLLADHESSVSAQGTAARLLAR